jgi:transglutaminase-like putative cysteine protease
MEFILTAPFDNYLTSSAFINFDTPAIRETALSLRAKGNSNETFVRHAFEFVRDKVSHSWDIQSRRVTATASDVLEHREGICYAKSNLLAGLCRSEGIPAGLCYQKLVLFDDPKDGYCLHALNAVYFEELDRWVRIDARGNKAGIDAQFSPTAERLAFPIRTELGEIDYPYIFAAPPACIADTLTQNDDCLTMYARGLPSDLDV